MACVWMAARASSARPRERAALVVSMRSRSAAREDDEVVVLEAVGGALADAFNGALVFVVVVLEAALVGLAFVRG